MPDWPLGIVSPSAPKGVYVWRYASVSSFNRCWIVGSNAHSLNFSTPCDFIAFRADSDVRVLLKLFSRISRRLGKAAFPPLWKYRSPWDSINESNSLSGIISTWLRLSQSNTAFSGCCHSVFNCSKWSFWSLLRIRVYCSTEFVFCAFSVRVLKSLALSWETKKQCAFSSANNRFENAFNTPSFLRALTVQFPAGEFTLVWCHSVIFPRAIANSKPWYSVSTLSKFNHSALSAITSIKDRTSHFASYRFPSLSAIPPGIILSQSKY